jgi:hypothetical protein
MDNGNELLLRAELEKYRRDLGYRTSEVRKLQEEIAALKERASLARPLELRQAHLIQLGQLLEQRYPQARAEDPGEFVARLLLEDSRT